MEEYTREHVYKHVLEKKHELKQRWLGTWNMKPFDFVCLFFKMDKFANFTCPHSLWSLFASNHSKTFVTKPNSFPQPNFFQPNSIYPTKSRSLPFCRSQTQLHHATAMLGIGLAPGPFTPPLRRVAAAASAVAATGAAVVAGKEPSNACGKHSFNGLEVESLVVFATTTITIITTTTTATTTTATTTTATTTTATTTTTTATTATTTTTTTTTMASSGRAGWWLGTWPPSCDDVRLQENLDDLQWPNSKIAPWQNPKMFFGRLW